jgi:hypothetical protein
MPPSLDMHFIIMPLAPRQNKIPSIKWYYLDLRVMCSALALSSNGGWFSKNILIGCIQLYSCSLSGSSITIRSCSIASLATSVGLTEGLDHFSIMTSDRVGALEEAIHVKLSASRLSNRGTYQTSNPWITSPSCALLLNILSSSHYCSHILSVLALLPAMNRPW